ncbi:HEAT repeat domain-containing protein [Acinetobacter baumannii]|uniref:HEAT repeat domain-containing protein n=1 Tax=Acinetobacter baumannii TaxID=470 RepID=UPI003892749C
MKKNILYVLLLALIILTVFIFFIKEDSTDQGSENPPTLNTKSSEGMYQDKITTNIQARQNTQKLNVPLWAQKVIDINENSQYSRIEKVEKLKDLLNQNKNDPAAVREILAQLANQNPIEAVDDILPFLKSNNPIVQSAALGALSNASLLTEKEHELKKTLPENNQIRSKISKEVNELKENPNTSKEVKQAIISSYMSTNPSIEDTKAMIESILNEQNITANESSYIATTILNGIDSTNTLSSIASKNEMTKDDIIMSIGSNIINNPETLNVLTSTQKKELYSFIEKNPPTTRNDDFSSKNDIWKNTLNSF